MGAWGTGLYQNDFAADLKADFKMWVGMPWDRDRLLAELQAHFQIEADAPIEDADQSAFWLAVTDLFHQYGLDYADTHQKALAVIDDGTDLRLLEELEMSPADLRRRAKMLQELKAKWASPAEKPRKIKPLKKEPLLLAEGDLIAYPTMNGSARHEPLGTEAAARYAFEPDATNVFVVLATQHVFHDMFARYFIAPLLCFQDPGQEPNLEIVKICFFICESHPAFRSFNPVGGWAEIRKKDLSFIEGRKIGNVRLNQTMLAEHFEALEAGRGQLTYARLGCLNMDFNIWSDVIRASAWCRLGEIDDLGSFLLEEGPG